MALSDRREDGINPAGTNLGQTPRSSMAGWLPIVMAAAIVVAMFALFMPSTTHRADSTANNAPSVNTVEPTPTPGMTPAAPTPNPTTTP